ncbi:MAG: DNA translocase FtsK [Eisenbergiella massiliensis]
MFAVMKIVAAVLLVLLIGVVLELIGGQVPSMEKYSVALLYKVSADSKAGGGVLAGSLAYLLNHFLGMVGAVLLVIVLAIICLVLITEKSFVGGVKSGSRKVYESAREDARVRKERARIRREELEARREEEERLAQEEEARRDAERILRMDKKVSGVMIDTTLAAQEKEAREESRERLRNDIHEITVEDAAEEKKESVKVAPKTDNIIDFDKIQIHTAGQTVREEEGEAAGELHPVKEPAVSDPLAQTYKNADVFSDMKEVSPVHITAKPVGRHVLRFLTARYSRWGRSLKWTLLRQGRSFPGTSRQDTGGRAADEVSGPAPERERPKARLSKEEHPLPGGGKQFTGEGRQLTLKDIEPAGKAAAAAGTAGQAAMAEMRREGAPAVAQIPKKERPYHFPPISLLQKVGGNNSGDSVRELKNTAAKLQQTLATFGVKVTITDISQGPSVTRYELQPEQGVKVSKILGLADDIKLNLAAMDIRIEAPIPGKAAIGIEVPNKENTMVSLRELMESKEFKGSVTAVLCRREGHCRKVVVSDIAKMPHMLIAGSTGSGKSVCINTLIMSILYKAAG